MVSRKMIPANLKDRNKLLNRLFILRHAQAKRFKTCSFSKSNNQHHMEPFIAEIKLFAGNFAPRGWAFCDGQLLPINQNQALFSLLGTIYGGDGRTTFALPDLRGRVPVHPGTGPGLSQYRVGEKGGAETVSLTVEQLAAHSHSLQASKQNGDTSDTPGASLADSKGSDRDYNKSGTVDTEMSKNSIGATGGGQAHENRQPYLAVHYIIALQGIFPSRS